jgi:PAS domain S-box-containing protein
VAAKGGQVLAAPVVLLADDDEDAHLLLKRAFVKAGVKASLLDLYDGSDVIKYLAGEGEYADRPKFPLPNLLLLDLKMPTTGFEVLEFLTDRRAEFPMQTVILSSSTHPADMERVRALGFEHYRVKPCNFEQLVELVKALEKEFLGVSNEGRPKGGRRITTPTATVKATGTARALPGEPPAPLYDSPEMFRLLVEQVKDYAIFMLDTGGIVRTWNEGARRIKGYEPREIIGKHLSIFYPQAEIETGKPDYDLRMAREMGRYEEQGWRLRKDNARFWASMVITPLRDKEGRLQGYATVTRDLTQTKLQEDSFQRLLESEERFRILVEQVKDYAIFMLDARGNVVSWNQGARRIKGYSSDEIIGKHFSIFYTQEALERDHPNQELTIAIREGRYEEEGWRKRKDGTRFWANVVITALWDKRGNLSGFAKVTRDLTQKKAADDALRQKTEALEAFAHTLSHDLRAPLRSIQSFADILHNDAEDLSEAEKARYLAKIRRAADSMNVMITDVLNLSQVSMAAAPEQVLALDQIMEEAISLLEGEITRTRADLTVQGPLPRVLGNRTLLVQIFSNLIVNALKFARPGAKPQIRIYAVLNDGHCEIHVEDQGVGIPPEMLEKIFAAFERGSATEAVAGMGVGLAIVRTAAERLGGSVSVRSKVDSGSDFIVNLRCVLATEPVA